MASICLKAISILAGNLNSGRSYLITAVPRQARDLHIDERAKILAFYFEVSLFTKKQICKTLVLHTMISCHFKKVVG